MDSIADQASDHVIVGLRHDQLKVDDAYAAVLEGNVGAVSLFVGTTRRHTEGKGETVRLEYDCYDDMAVAEMKRLGNQVLHRWTVERVFLVHRIGSVPVGEASIIIAVSAAHRQAAMDACRFLIDTLKETVPIWKKEVYDDGRTEWIQGVKPR